MNSNTDSFLSWLYIESDNSSIGFKQLNTVSFEPHLSWANTGHIFYLFAYGKYQVRRGWWLLTELLTGRSGREIRGLKPPDYRVFFRSHSPLHALELNGGSPARRKTWHEAANRISGLQHLSLTFLFLAAVISTTWSDFSDEPSQKVPWMFTNFIFNGWCKKWQSCL